NKRTSRTAITGQESAVLQIPPVIQVNYRNYRYLLFNRKPESSILKSPEMAIGAYCPLRIDYLAQAFINHSASFTECAVRIFNTFPVYRDIQINEKIFKKWGFEQFGFPHIHCGMVDIKGTKYDIEIRSMITDNNAGFWQRVFF